MCGIAGIWGWRGERIEPETLARFTRSLAHRGPDGEGLHFEENGCLGLGHRRLAILDLSPAGHQPMGFLDGRYWVVFNGEIYNFLELREELERGGYRFRSETDTEVIPAAYDRWGPACQLRFNGMWAFALWDRRERTLFLSRDRFGVKPLFYLNQPGRFAFASELKAFLHLDGFAARQDEEVLRRTLADINGMKGSPDCLLEGVKQLPGGHCLSVRSGKARLAPWWRTLEHLPDRPRKRAEQAERFRELFTDACRLRLRSDVPVATCLSGGLDSSSVLCTLADLQRHSGGGSERRAADWQRAFVFGFPGTPLDERSYAEIAIQHTGAVPRHQTLSTESLLEALEQVVYDYESIHFTLPAAMWSIYRELRRDGVVVSLDGHGADEMLGGYAYYTAHALHAAGGLLHAPRRTLDLVATLHGLYPPGGPIPPPSRLRLLLNSDPILRSGLGAAWGVAHRAARLLRGPRGKGLCAPAAEPWLRQPVPPPVAEAPDDEAREAFGPLNALLYEHFHRAILPGVLQLFDRCSMAHGVEVRTPFLDWRLVCYAFALPEESKIGGGFTKRVLRQAMRGVVPDALRLRKGKIGFNAPLPMWFLGPLRGWLEQQVNDPEFLGSEIWNGPAIRDFVQERQRAGAWTWIEGERVWPFLQAHLWRRTFVARPPGESARLPE